MSLALISGRYYPRLLAHPMLRPIVRDMQGHANEAAARLDGHHLFALEGILPGFFNASEATRWKASRAVMVQDAAADRSAGLARAWDARRQGPPVEAEAQEQQGSGSIIAPGSPTGDAAAVPEPGQGRGQDANANAKTETNVDVQVGMHNLEPAAAKVAIDMSTMTNVPQVVAGSSPVKSVPAV